MAVLNRLVNLFRRTRVDREIEADLEGVKIAVSAGFSYRSGVRSAFREQKFLGDYSNFEGLKGTHPPWNERLTFLDRKEPELWKAMAAFQNATFFLSVEQYRDAERCLLGGLLRDNVVINDVIQLVRTENFYFDAHQKVYQGILALNDKANPVDLVTLAEWLREQKYVGAICMMRRWPLSYR